MAITSGSNTLSQEIFEYLSADGDVTLPALPNLSAPAYTIPTEVGNGLYGNISKISDEDLTTGIVGGAGMFDKLMTALKAHLVVELNAGRITGDQYTKAYIAMTTQALEMGVQFLLNREQTYWQSLLVQHQAQRAEIEAVTAKVQLEIAKATLQQSQAQAIVQNQLSLAQYALAKMNLSVADQDFLLKTTQKLLGEKDILLRQEQIEAAEYQLAQLMPVQKKLLEEQVEVQRAQTLNNRTDGAVVTGSVGKQKDLYTQQIDSYIKDSQYKIAKTMVDTWVTRKTIDEGAPTPAKLEDGPINIAMTAILAANNLD